MDLGLFLLRAVVGLTVAAHGTQKLFGWFGGGGLTGTGRWFAEKLRMRPGEVFAFVAGATELGAGVLLFLGFLTPFGAAGVIGVMAVAAWAVNRGNGFFITANGYEYNLVLGAAAAALAFTGPGGFSLDRALGWDLFGVSWGFVAVAFGLVTAAAVVGPHQARMQDEVHTDETLDLRARTDEEVPA